MLLVPWGQVLSYIHYYKIVPGQSRSSVNVCGVGGWVPVWERFIAFLSPCFKWVKAATLLHLSQVQMKNAWLGRIKKNKTGKGGLAYLKINNHSSS